MAGLLHGFQSFKGFGDFTFKILAFIRKLRARNDIYIYLDENNKPETKDLKIQT